MLTCKPGVEFTIIAPAGLKLLDAIARAGAILKLPIVITSACDGVHSGPNDPHYLGAAYDLRTHDFTDAQKRMLLSEIMHTLAVNAMDAPLTVSSGLATVHFFGFLEAQGTPNEHMHLQQRNQVSYTMADYLAA